MKGTIGHPALKGVECTNDGLDVRGQLHGVGQNDKHIHIAVRPGLATGLGTIKHDGAKSLPECSVESRAYFQTLPRGQHWSLLQQKLAVRQGVPPIHRGQPGLALA